MLAANVCAADFLARRQHPGCIRVHEGPTPERLANVRGVAEGAGPGSSRAATSRSRRTTRS